jgi:AcrR family transcriptional regulator
MCEALDPRVERSQHVILDATLAELAEVGYGAMSIESIAKRAGVGKATVYRHWRGKLDLVESALERLKEGMVTPTEGTARERITEMLAWLVDYMSTPPASECLPAIVSAAQYDESVRAFHLRFTTERRSHFVRALEAGVHAGELPADLDPVFITDALVAPIFYRRLMTDRPFTVGEVDQLVRTVLGPAGSSAASSSSSSSPPPTAPSSPSPS